MDPYPIRLPERLDVHRILNWRKQYGQTEKKSHSLSWLNVITPRAFPIEPLPGGGKINRFLWDGLMKRVDRFVKKKACLLVIGKPSELAFQLLMRYPTVRSVFDLMDDFPTFFQGVSKRATAKCMHLIAGKADRISVSSKALKNRLHDYSEKIRIIPNACTVDLPAAVSQRKKKDHEPVLGYVGTIGHWFDWPLVCHLAERNPTSCIRLIGPNYSTQPKVIPDNIQMLPGCDHSVAMDLMQGFSVGLIPFKCNVLTESVDPIKYYEYRSIGLPILSTRFGEMIYREGQTGIFFMDESTNLSNLVASALSCHLSANEIQEFRKSNSWDKRFETGFGDWLS